MRVRAQRECAGLRPHCVVHLVCHGGSSGEGRHVKPCFEKKFRANSKFVDYGNIMSFLGGTADRVRCPFAITNGVHGVVCGEGRDDEKGKSKGKRDAFRGGETPCAY